VLWQPLFYNARVPKPDSTEFDTFMLNGLLERHLRGQTISELLVKKEATGLGVAVERNQQVVKSAEHAQTLIEVGDKIEIVRLVGGG
jgi:thiamine biosynthesis protein ThiS